MSGLFRTLAVAIIALWLPLCCCQVMALSSTGGDCCAGHDDCCTGDEGDPSPTLPDEGCTHCVDKDVPPSGIALDSYFVMAQVSCFLALPPTVRDPALVHATEIAGRWDQPPPGAPPTLAPFASARCSQLSLWLI